MAVTRGARAQAAAEEEITLGPQVHTVRHGQMKASNFRSPRLRSSWRVM
jgi:hypothetical protein